MRSDRGLFVTELAVPGALSPRAVRALRWELFAFREVREVLFSTSGSILVIHDGEGDVEQWRSLLRSAT